jgi:Uma2 family endonuclease
MNAPVRLFVTPERVRLTVDDFFLLNDHGAFAAYTKTELIDGEIYGVNSQWSRHARAKTRLARSLADAIDRANLDLEALIEVAIRASDHSAPEPDITVTRFRGDREVPADTIALVVEVSDTTLATDLGRKAAIYAAAGIPDYWVIDVEGRRAVLHARPEGGAYGAVTEAPLGGALAASATPGLTIDTAALLA